MTTIEHQKLMQAIVEDPIDVFLIQLSAGRLDFVDENGRNGVFYALVNGSTDRAFAFMLSGQQLTDRGVVILFEKGSPSSRSATGKGRKKLKGHMKLLTDFISSTDCQGQNLFRRWQIEPEHFKKFWEEFTTFRGAHLQNNRVYQKLGEEIANMLAAQAAHARQAARLKMLRSAKKVAGLP